MAKTCKKCGGSGKVVKVTGKLTLSDKLKGKGAKKEKVTCSTCGGRGTV